jgi:3-isopropylmalate/(R)-2-methylmalate dehydratase small subunit
MEPFTSVSGRATPIPLPNVDTDIIMPKAFLKGVDRKGLDVGAFNLLRFANGKPNPDFVLNRPGYEECKFLVVGPNFGCGSSREHAVWGLAQLGIRALIGTTFAGIFNDNCRNNGVLTINLPAETLGALMSIVSDPHRNTLTVDLGAQTIVLQSGQNIAFDIEPERKSVLMKGLDPVGATLEFAGDIKAFEALHRESNPWFF